MLLSGSCKIPFLRSGHNTVVPQNLGYRVGIKSEFFVSFDVWEFQVSILLIGSSRNSDNILEF